MKNLKNKSKIGISLLGLGIVLLAGCAKYEAEPLGALTPNNFNENKSGIAVVSKPLTKAECRRYLGRNVLAKGYQPIHITLSNNTDESYQFYKSNINMSCVSAEVVGQRVHTSTAARATSYGVASLFVWPLAIPAVVDGVGSSNANKKLDRDFERKELVDQEVKPFTSINGLIFVQSRDYRPNFQIKLVGLKNNKQFVLNANDNISC